MAKVNSTEVGRCFGRREEAEGYGSMRVEVSNGVAFGYSYAEPVAATDGSVTLATIVHWSVTTAGHVGRYRANGPGRVLPATTKMLHDLRWRPVDFDKIVKQAEKIQAEADRRTRAKGMPMGRPFEGTYYGNGVAARKVGNRWHLYATTDDTLTFVSDHRTLTEARVAAWDASGVTPKGWPVYDDARKVGA